MITEIYSKEKISEMTSDARAEALIAAQDALMSWGDNPSPLVVAPVFRKDVDFACMKLTPIGVKEFFICTCPCGKVDKFPLNGFPGVDTRHSCGNPLHWVVKYEIGGAL